MPKPFSIKRFTKPLLLAVGLSLTSFITAAYAEQPVHVSVQSLLNNISDFSAAFRPPNNDAPRQTVPAGSRDATQCSGDNAPMRLLLPETNEGLTAENHPVLWMEMPSTRAQGVLLVFQTEAGDYHSRTQFAIPEATDQGIVQFQLPETVEGLLPGENYRWTLSILCEGYLNPRDPFFSGWIKQVNYSPEVAQTLSNASVERQVAILQKTGYWYDIVPLILQNQDAFSAPDAL